MKKTLAALALLALSACASAPAGDRADWRCDNGRAYSARTNASGVEVFAGGQIYNLSASGGGFSNGQVTYSSNGALAGAVVGGPYTNCHR